MKQILLSILATIAFGLTSMAQESSTDFYFNYKKSDLTSEHTAKLDELVSGITVDAVEITVTAYCDIVGGSSYNVGLGQARANLFVSYFESKGVPTSKINAVNNGSSNPLASNDTEEGRSQNRRVIIKITGASVNASDVAPAEAAEEVAEEEVATIVGSPLTCSQDTMIHLLNGAIMKINKCEYLKYSDCLIVKTFSTTEAIRDGKYTTDGVGGQVLTSGGIIEVRTCSDEKMDSTITVYIPVNQRCTQVIKPDVWTSFQNGVWNSRSKRATTESFGGKTYYTFKTRMSGTANFGAEQDPAPEFKITAHKGLKFKSIVVYSDCEMGAYKVVLDKPSKKIKMKLPCTSGLLHFDIEGEVKGEDITLSYISSNDIVQKGKQKTCEIPDVKKRYCIYPTSTGGKE